jgi:hypothetical protein
MSDTNPVGFAQAVPRDRAATVTATIVAIVVDALRAWLRGGSAGLADVRGQIENVLREEFEDVTRQVRGEREPPPDAAA